MASRAFFAPIFLCGAAVAVATSIAVAAPDMRAAKERCFGPNEVAPDMRIAACDAVIGSANSSDGEIAHARGMRGAILVSRGEYEHAIDDYDAILEKNAEDTAALTERCWARALARHDLDGALADCNDAVRLAPREARGLGTRAFVYLRLGLDEAAVSDYSAALEIEPRNAEYLFGRGRAKTRHGDLDGGRADMDAARAIDPEVEKTFARYEHSEGTGFWAAMVEFWRSAMKMIY